MPTLDRSATLLSLDEWREAIGWNPWHFWGLAGDKAPVTSSCNTTVTQYGWQSTDAAGRDDILQAIAAAEESLIEYLGFSPAPRWEYDELPFPQFNDRRGAFLSSVDAVGEWMPFKVKRGELLEIGAQARALIGSPSVALSDEDGDGLKETFTLTIATTVTDPEQIAVYFDTAERFDGSTISERWRVRPVNVSISGGTATITGRTWTIVKPVLYEGWNASTPLDPMTETNFAGTLAVYRLYTDTTAQGEFVWETPPGACLDCDSSMANSLDPAAEARVSARYVIRHAEIGYIAGETAEYDSGSAEWIAKAWGLSYPPARVRVAYRAGRKLDEVSGQMSRQMKTIVARMAAAELSRRICACENANRELWRWQFDRARAAGSNDEQYSIDQRDLGNPFGTREGHIFAWKQVKTLALMTGAVV